jgi:hypothetical protein
MSEANGMRSDFRSSVTRLVLEAAFLTAVGVATAYSIVKTKQCGVGIDVCSLPPRGFGAYVLWASGMLLFLGAVRGLALVWRLATAPTDRRHADETLPWVIAMTSVSALVFLFYVWLMGMQ